MALTKVTGQVIKNTTDVTVGVLTVTNTLAVGGTVSVGGTLTYEDVTNIDSVGLITARNGIVVGSGITLSKDGDGFFTGIVTATTFSGALSGSGANITALNASNISSGTVPTARLGSGTASSSTFLRGDSTFAAVTSTTINNNADNRLITGSGTADTLEGEATLTYNGTDTFELQPASATPAIFIGDSNRTGAGQGLAQFRGNWNGTTVARITFDSGDDTSNKDDGIIRFDTAPSGSLVEAVRITSAGDMGLGTNSPDRKIHCHNSSNTTNVRAKFSNGTTGEGGSDGFEIGINGSDPAEAVLVNYEASPMAFFTSGSQRMTIDSSGRLLLGTTTEGHAAADNLTVADSGNSGITIRSGTTNNGTIYFSDGTSGSDEYKGAVIYNHDENYLRCYTNGGEKLRITSGGSVNIGDDFTQTTYKTQIEATDPSVLRLVTDSDDASGVELVLRKDSASPADEDNIGNIYFQGNDDGGNATFYASMEAYSDDVSNGSENGYIRFRTRNDGSMAERLRIHSDGRISANTTTKYGIIHSLEDQFNPGNEKWLTDASFVSSGSFGGGYVLLDGSKGYSMYCAGSGQNFFIQHHSSTTAAASGGVTITNGATSWTSASDERDKENLVTISDAITKIKTLRTVTGNYTWQTDVKHAFLIAQDVQDVLPEAVDIVNTSEETENQRLGLRYTEVIPLLTAALKEAIVEIESLKSRLDTAGL